MSKFFGSYWRRCLEHLFPERAWQRLDRAVAQADQLVAERYQERA